MAAQKSWLIVVMTSKNDLYDNRWNARTWYQPMVSDQRTILGYGIDVQYNARLIVLLSIRHLMNSNENNLDSAKLVTVAERPDDLSASILISILQEAGIRAVATGGFTSGFRAEAPGMVAVKTIESDAERAKQILADTNVQWPEEPE